MKQKELKELQNSTDYKLMTLLEQMLSETYVAIAENINLTDIYGYESLGQSWWSFRDKEGFEHQIRINYNPGVKNKELTIKFFWIKDEKPCYEKPPATDEKVFNTYIKIFIDEILPKMPKLLEHFGLNRLTLDPTDALRYRLYRIAINQLLDKSKYKLVEDQSNNLLYIELI